MKSAGEILQELGFNKMASDSVKEAFLRHLIKNNTGVNVQTYQYKHSLKPQTHLAQLSFNFETSLDKLQEAI